MKLQVTARTNTRGRSQPQLLTYLAGKTFQLLWVAPKTTAWWNWWRKPHVSSSSANPQGTSGWLLPPKGAGSRAGGGYGWCRGCGWLWMGFVETRSVVLALPLSKTRHWAPQWCQWDCPLHTQMVSALSSSSGSALHAQIQLHTMLHPHYI